MDSVAPERLFARTNPLHDGTRAEVDALLAAGARTLMLPMFRSAAEAARFVDLVDGRATVVGLVETADALEAIDAIALVPGVDELHVGINDLALDLGLPNRFSVLLDPRVERLAATVLASGRRLGLGGIGRLDGPALPIPADLVYARLARLGAQATLLARSYATGAGDLGAAVRASRERLRWWASRPAAEHDRAREDLAAAIASARTF